ncbi:unnamed protein product, partial [Cyprideis torosa]
KYTIMAYMLALFTEDQSIGTIHKDWLIGSSQCYYPPEDQWGLSTMKRHLLKGSSPACTWKTYDIQVIPKSGTEETTPDRKHKRSKGASSAIVADDASAYPLGITETAFGPTTSAPVTPTAIITPPSILVHVDLTPVSSSTTEVTTPGCFSSQRFRRVESTNEYHPEESETHTCCLICRAQNKVFQRDIMKKLDQILHQQQKSTAENILTWPLDITIPVMEAVHLRSINELLEDPPKKSAAISYLKTVDLSAIQQALQELEQWCDDNQLEVNVQKTKAMKIRKGGRLKRTDRLFYKNQQVEFVKAHEYLGLTLQSRLTFTEHILKKKRKALIVIATLRNLPLVSIDTAMRIYRMKIQPIVTYLLDLLSPGLTCKQMEELDRVKAAFVKRALGVHRNASATLALEIVGTGTLCEDLARQGYVFDEQVWRNYKEKREEKLLQLSIEQYHRAPCFQFNEWRKASQKTRSIYTRASIHGFHHKICKYLNCYEIGPDCCCVLCDGKILTKYHIIHCDSRDDLPLPDFIRFLEKID